MMQYGLLHLVFILLLCPVNVILFYCVHTFLYVTKQHLHLLTYLRVDLDVVDLVQYILVAMMVLGVEVILRHQSSLLRLGGVAQRPSHDGLSPCPHQQSQHHSEAQEIHFCVKCNKNKVSQTSRCW